LRAKSQQSDLRNRQGGDSLPLSETNQKVKQMEDEIYETTYHVDWTVEGDFNVWRANFTDKESYLRFVNQRHITVLEVTTTRR